MRFDMHCHTHEGSVDAKIDLSEYVSILRSMGFKGMLLTDHNSYDSYRYYRERRDDAIFHDFTILRGIEYDTSNAGHMLIVLPEAVKLPLLEVRGLPVEILIDIVHLLGGIVGPAHPCGEPGLCFGRSRVYRRSPEIVRRFDFIEVFNSCETAESNREARKLARDYDMVAWGGSDSHRADCVGTAYTELPAGIRTESDLICCVKERCVESCGGDLYHGTFREHVGSIHTAMTYSYWVYNKLCRLINTQALRAGVKEYREQIAGGV